MNSKSALQSVKPTNIKQLQILQLLVERVYIPLESKVELRTTLQKFTSQIEHSSQQVSGTITIELPDVVDQIDDETALKNYELIEKYEDYIWKWSQTIRKTILKEASRKTEKNSALTDIMLQRSRSENLSTLYQQLQNQLWQKLDRDQQTYLEDNQSSVLEFNCQFAELTKGQADTKDNVQFLITLESLDYFSTLQGSRQDVELITIDFRIND
ncbi:unnamed protein product [Paramecium sonneborni]|uniref:Uncharacterized protein n=1 Tax=Paramecium sonneborni TaxID=65129 RepID=A0A8S1NIC7_9CILI|nr:unnamed protein product [Paramecium sonneborni]